MILVSEEEILFRVDVRDNIHGRYGARSLVVKMRVDGVVRKQTIYVIIGIDLEGNKSCLGLYFAETESAKYWLAEKVFSRPMCVKPSIN